MNPKLIAVLMIVSGAITTFAGPGTWNNVGSLGYVPRLNRGLGVLPGYPCKVYHDTWLMDGSQPRNYKIQFDGNDGINKCVDRAYQCFFPGCLAHGVNVQFIPVGSKDGAYGNTYMEPTDPSYRSIGNHSPIGAIRIEVYDSNPDTVAHELSHAYNASIRGNTGSYHFFDEGMAVLTSYVFNVEKCEREALTLESITSECPNPKSFRAFCLERFSQVPPGHDYPLAGFFMAQIYDICGSSTLKYLITADQRVDNVEHVYGEILRGAQDGPSHLDEDGFWKLMYVRLVEWTK